MHASPSGRACAGCAASDFWDVLHFSRQEIDVYEKRLKE
jgi:Ni,Fe-hydrogenase I small subunit